MRRRGGKPPGGPVPGTAGGARETGTDCRETGAVRRGPARPARSAQLGQYLRAEPP